MYRSKASHDSGFEQLRLSNWPEMALSQAE